MDIKHLVTEHTEKVIEQMLIDLLNQSHVEIKFDFFEKDQWSFVTVNNYENDNEFSIRYHIDNSVDLLVGYYDDEDEYYEIIKPLSEEEAAMMPEGLKKVMKKVANDEEGLRVASSLLTLHKK